MREESGIIRDIRGMNALGIKIDAVGIVSNGNAEQSVAIQPIKWMRYNYGIMMVTGNTINFESAMTGSIRLHPGTMFLLSPGNWYRYGSSKGEVWEQNWVAIDGTVIRDFFAQYLFALNPPYFTVTKPHIAIKYYNEIFRYVKKNRKYEAVLSVYKLMALIEEHCVRLDYKPSLFDELVSRILSNPQQQIDLDVEAQKLNMSYVYFRKLFKNETGIAPQKYIQRARIQRSCDLLREGMMVKNVAFEVGYEDPLYFSRVFKRVMKCSPQQFSKKFL